MTYFVETDQFEQMLSYHPYAISSKEKKKAKYSLLDRIQGMLGDKWNRLKEGTRQAFDMICFLGAERGFVYAGDGYLAERHDISDRTVRTRLKELEALGEIVKVHRRTKKCNGRGKPIYLFVNHPYFQYWVELLGLHAEDFQTRFQTENSETPCESREEEVKKIPTFSLPSLKQESNTISNHKIIQYISNRVKDSVNKGTTITYLSSYINKIVSSLERQAIYAENRRVMALQKQQLVQNTRLFQELSGARETETAPLYNWLEQ